MTKPFLHLGVHETWTQQIPFGLWPADRARHLHLVGQTGTDKSTLMTHLVRQDIEAGAGVTLIDPHGDLADVVCDVIPSRRIDDVAILDPTDIAHPPAFNPFYRVPVDDRARVASNWVATFKHAYPDSWGPRLEHILRNVVRLVLDAPDRARPTIVSVARVLVESGYRDGLLTHCTDERVGSFFETEFEIWNDRFRAEALSPVQTKLGPFLQTHLCATFLGSGNQPSH